MPREPEPAEPVYRHVDGGRSVLNALLAAGGVLFGAMAAAHGAPWFFFIPVAIFVGFPLFEVLTGRVRVFEAGPQGIAWSIGRRRTEVAAERIAGLRFVDWSDSTDLAVDLVDGTTLDVPAACVPPRGPELFRALDALGVPVDPGRGRGAKA